MIIIIIIIASIGMSQYRTISRVTLHDLTINQQVCKRDVLLIKSVITLHAGQFYSLTEVSK